MLPTPIHLSRMRRSAVRATAPKPEAIGKTMSATSPVTRTMARRRSSGVMRASEGSSTSAICSPICPAGTSARLYASV